MRKQQSGFTLVEIAIVLVIIGLLLGGILKGQELINSAKVKNLANDYRVIPTYIYAYQDKFKALPGDDSAAVSHLGSSACDGSDCKNGNGNGVIDGNWNDAASTKSETVEFWSHVRIANLASGPTVTTDGSFTPRNAMTGVLGVSSTATGQLQISGMSGTYQVCSAGIPGKFAKQLDVQMDDGNTAAGSMRAVPDGSAMGTAGTATASIVDGDNYTVCMTF